MDIVLGLVLVGAALFIHFQGRKTKKAQKNATKKAK